CWYRIFRAWDATGVNCFAPGKGVRMPPETAALQDLKLKHAQLTQIETHRQFNHHYLTCLFAQIRKQSSQKYHQPSLPCAFQRLSPISDREPSVLRVVK